MRFLALHSLYTIQESPVKNGHDFSSNDIVESRDDSVKILEINGRFWASVVSSYIQFLYPNGIEFSVNNGKTGFRKRSEDI
ncbi:hypothetical protein [Pedobacter sp. B4-66]|uniref:hypothetical protein n=1 Tax=Pedobacter sp. B4-66 TaxID=2817280 RepID=UPI001BDAA42A|nr:hypothetical protein [Pedobacter sp. B4-66]